jgi:hypothetical protein
MFWGGHASGMSLQIHWFILLDHSIELVLMGRSFGLAHFILSSGLSWGKGTAYKALIILCFNETVADRLSEVLSLMMLASNRPSQVSGLRSIP